MKAKVGGFMAGTDTLHPCVVIMLLGLHDKAGPIAKSCTDCALAAAAGIG